MHASSRIILVANSCAFPQVPCTQIDSCMRIYCVVMHMAQTSPWLSELRCVNMPLLNDTSMQIVTVCATPTWFTICHSWVALQGPLSVPFSCHSTHAQTWPLHTRESGGTCVVGTRIKRLRGGRGCKAERKHNFVSHTTVQYNFFSQF